MALQPPVRAILIGSEAYTPVHSAMIVQQQQVVPIEAQFHPKPDLVRHDLLQFFIRDQRILSSLRAVALQPPVRAIVIGSEAYTPVHGATIVQQQQVVPIEAQFHAKPDLVRHDLLQFFIREQRFVA